MDRLQFLKNEWIPYPPAPKGWRHGRIQSIKSNSIELEKWGRVEVVPVSEKTVLKGVRGDFAFSIEVLQVGDWLAFHQEQLLLLAPALKKPRKVQVQAQALSEWESFLVRVREFFKTQGFHEVATPTVVACPGTEPYLDPVPAGKDRYLPTSPELHLKKALSMGLGPLFEIRPCFRDKEVSDKHQPEFWMLEWYRPMASLEEIKADVIQLIHFLSQERPAFETQSLAELFQKNFQFQLTPQTSKEELVELASRLGLHFRSTDSWDDLFHLIFVDQLEEKLGEKAPLFLENYPPSQAALARLTPEGWGDRFEFYWKGFEIANAFHELNDPLEQTRRAAEDNQKKIEIGKAPVAVDSDFLDALFEGMPPSAGIALGLERLFMCLTNYRRFSDFRVFSES